MSKTPSKLLLVCALFWVVSPVLQAKSNKDCSDKHTPAISFVEFQSLDLTQSPPGELTVQGKLKLPAGKSGKSICSKSKKSKKSDKSGKSGKSKMKLAAVLILHGSSGVDSRGDFYARALNARGIATLEIDMWEARGVTAANRPPLPIFTYPDAFAALAFLSTQGDIDPDRIGVLGFSWGGVVTMASAEELYAGQFGGGLKFAAHAAHYPVCYGYNTVIPGPILPPPPGNGLQWLDLTGAPVLIQIGTEDDYDNGADQCRTLVNELQDPDDQDAVEVVAYEGAFHAWDRLQVPITVSDPFADEGSWIMSPGPVLPQVEIVPDVDQAYEARRKVVRFFRRNL